MALFLAQFSKVETGQPFLINQTNVSSVLYTQIPGTKEWADVQFGN